MVKFFCLLTFGILYMLDCYPQLRVTIPWSSALNVTFGNSNSGTPLSIGSSDFTYTTNSCPRPGEYSVVKSDQCFNFIQYDAGHIFFGTNPIETNSGYMMLVNYTASAISKTVFQDTIKNICENSDYLFWAGIRNLSNSKCFYPHLSFIVETISGQLIKSFTTGDINGLTDKGAPFFGYVVPDPQTSFPKYYGGIFSLPAGTSAVIVKIITNPSNANPSCTNTFAVDNILLTPMGPDITIEDANFPGGWVTGACFNGSKTVNLSASIGNGYYDFAEKPDFKNASFKNPALQWEQSTDDGYTWTDIPGETNYSFSHPFSIADTFFVRLRVSENYNINNPNCSVVSNIIQVQVDGLPKDFDITSNSPVCTDGDIVLKVKGGASYVVTGPNGFYDNSPNPHIYHPVLADSGWYYAQIKSFGGCVVNDSTFVRVIGPDLKISINDSAICYGRSTRLNASGGNVYVWSPAEGLSNPNIPNPLAKPLTTTTYQLKITDETNCSAYGSVTVLLRNSILKAKMVAPNVICPNDFAVFRDTSIGNIQNWDWSFGNGQTSNQQYPTPQQYRQWQSNINYPVTLIVTDSSGCADTTTLFVKAVNNCYIAVPSAFTPNHDGLNDYLYPLNAYKATNLVFKVYNRSGHIVFETKDWTRKWDGTVSAIPQPPGTYVWTLNYTDSNQKISLKGTTTLIR